MNTDSDSYKFIAGLYQRKWGLGASLYTAEPTKFNIHFVRFQVHFHTFVYLMEQPRLERIAGKLNINDGVKQVY